MTTGSPRKDAKISLIGLAMLAVLSLAGVGYVLDRWLVAGAITQRIASACQSLVAACGAAISPYIPYLLGARVLLAGLSAGAIFFALVKAVSVVFFAHRLKAHEGPTAATPERVVNIARQTGAEETNIRYVDSAEPIAYTDGLIRSTIHLSRGLVEALDDAQLKGVIAHEYAHVKRRDNIAIFIALALRDFLFILPVSHLLFAIFMREKELAADDMAVEITGDPVGLADAIVRVARLKGAGGVRRPAYATFFPDRAVVRDRVVRLIDDKSPVRPSIVKTAAVTLISITILGAFASLAIAQPTPGKAAISKACQNKPECVRQRGACCVK